MKRAVKIPRARNGTRPERKAVELSELFDLLDSSDSLFSFRARVTKGFEQNATAYAAIMGLSRAMSQVPWCLFRQEGEEQTEIEEHPLIDLMARPNPEQGGRRFVQMMVIHLYVAGKTFIHSEAIQDDGLVEALRLLRPDRMRLRTETNPRAGWIYTQIDGSERKIPFDRVLPLFLPDPDNDWDGLSPLRPGEASVAQGNHAREWNKNLLASNARPPGILKGKWDMNQEQKDKAIKKFLEKYGGFRNAGNPIMQGDLEWSPVAQTAQELEWLEGMRLADRSVAVALGYPPQMLGDKDAMTFANYQEARRSLYEDHILPLLYWILDDINAWLVKPYGEDLFFAPNLDEVSALKEQQELLWKRIKEADSLTLNEKREALGYDQAPSPAGDLILYGTVLLDGKTGEVLKGGKDPEPQTVAPPRAQSMPAEAAAKESTGLDTKDVRVQYWKSFDARRHYFEDRAIGIFRGLMKEERNKVLRAIKQAGYAAGLADAAAAEIGKNKDSWQRAYVGVYQMVVRDFAQLTTSRMRKSYGAGLEAKALEDSIDPWDDVVSKYILTQSGDKITGIIQTTRQAVRSVLGEGVEKGEGIDALAKRVDALYLEDIIPHRSEVIARTEVINASNLGAVEAAKATGLVLRKQWIATADERTRDAHAAADGQIVPMDQPFLVGGAQLQWPGDTSLGAPASQTIQCFPGNTEVQASGIERAFRRYYNGDLFEIRTAFGHRLSGTPNHPVLTTRGWVPLGLLVPGDRVMSRGFGKRLLAGRPNPEHMPSLIEEVYGALASVAVPQRVRIGAVDFHGDGLDGHVDIAGASLQLPLRGTTEAAKPADHRLLSASGHGETALFRRGDSQGHLHGMSRSLLAASDSRMSGFRPTSPLLGSSVAHALDHGRRSSARYDTIRDQVVPDGPAGHAEHFGDELLRSSAQVKPDYVLEKRRVRFSGHVFNLQTGSGLYTANGVLVHNCRCAVGFLEE